MNDVSDQQLMELFARDHAVAHYSPPRSSAAGENSMTCSLRLRKSPGVLAYGRPMSSIAPREDRINRAARRRVAGPRFELVVKKKNDVWKVISLNQAVKDRETAKRIGTFAKNQGRRRRSVLAVSTSQR